MTKAELIERIARARDLPPDITKKDIATILGLAFEELATYFAKAKVTRTSSPRFTFPRFGTFTKKKRNARRGVNPRTLEPIQIEACHTLDFKASRELRESMNPGSDAAARPTEDGERTGSTRSTKTKRKASAKASSRKSRRGDHGSEVGVGRRRLTPRDEDAELDALIDDDVLFDEDAGLPESPLQRASTGKRGRARTGS